MSPVLGKPYFRVKRPQVSLWHLLMVLFPPTHGSIPVANSHFYSPHPLPITAPLLWGPYAPLHHDQTAAERSESWQSLLSICTPSGAMPFCSARLNFPDAAKSKEAQGAPPANCALHAPGGTHASLAPQGNQLMPWSMQVDIPWN